MSIIGDKIKGKMKKRKNSQFKVNQPIMKINLTEKLKEKYKNQNSTQVIEGERDRLNKIGQFSPTLIFYALDKDCLIHKDYQNECDSFIKKY
jgi:hypothetical protein